MKIRLNEMVFYGYHGVHAEERKLGQRFIVTLTLFTDPSRDRFIEHLDQTVDYTLVYARIKQIFETEQFMLLEACANRIADDLLQDFPLIERLKLRIEKPSVPIQGSLKSVEVCLERER